MKNCIETSMRRNKIIMKINEDATYEEVIKELKKKIPQIKEDYIIEETPIKVEGKVLSSKEMREIKQIIQKEIEVDIIFNTPQELGLAGIKKVYEQDVKDSQTRFVRGSLRSGQRLEFEGSLVIIGDVNSGSEVIASENIVIVGALRGLAHAGAKGNKKAIIAANSIEGPQVRIANVVKEIEKEDIETKKQYAYIVEENIILEE